MRRGLWIGTGIGIGISLSIFLAWSTLKVHAEPARPQTQPQGADSNTGPMIMGTGGATDNKQDLCWVMFRDGKSQVKPGAEVDRYVLCLYKAEQGGKAFDLVDVRDISFDVKAVQLNVAGHDPRFSPAVMKKTYADTLKQP